ncbi:MAG TPA: cytochrome-c oxidase, cbb3-type subunit III [Pseudomonadales bacterium]|nr:cytochrome-c oxidase, cbb3-type subunit III [Pseudomonadales bacterium]
MTSFWSGWIIVLTTISIILLLWVLFANRKTSVQDENNRTTGHVYDGIEEYDNPLPAWWFKLFLGTVIFSVGYLIAYPGMGNFQGLLNWSSEGQWQQEMAVADSRLQPILDQYATTDMDALAAIPAAMKMGARIYANNCAQCHGSDARGSYGFPNLTDNDWLYGNKPQELMTTIVHGRQAVMPAWQAILGEEGIRNMAAFVVNMSGRPADAERVAKAEPQYMAMCMACHGADGKGNQMLGAPNLTDDIWLYGGSPAMIEHTLRVGRNGRMPAFKDVLQEEKIHIVAAYVKSLSQP